MSDHTIQLDKSSSNERKRKSDKLQIDGQLNESGKRIKTCEDVIELSDDSDELKIVNEIKMNETGDQQSRSGVIQSKSDVIQLKNETKLTEVGFYLTKVLKGIDERYNNELTLTIRQLLSKQFNPTGKLKQSCQFRYANDLISRFIFLNFHSIQLSI